MIFPKFLIVSSFTVALLLVMSRSSVAQEHDTDSHGTVEEHSGTEHETHPNHFGGIVGVSTHHNDGSSATTLGLEYARQLSPRWAIAAYLELVSSKIERDLIVAIGGVFYPWKGVGLVLASGVESVEKEVTVDGEPETESELELMIRLGVGYGFKLTPAASLGPAVFADHAGDRWTTLVGLAMTVGF